MQIDQKRRDEIMMDLRNKAKNPMNYVAPLYGKRRNTPMVEIWEEPSFLPNVTWAVFAAYDPNPQRKNVEPFVIEAIWDERKEWTRVANLTEEPLDLEPVFSVTKASLDRKRLTNLMIESAKVTFPFNPDEMYSGLDGSFYGVKIDKLFQKFSLSWWEDGPDAWQSIIKWTSQMRAFLIDATLKMKSTDNSESS